MLSFDCAFRAAYRQFVDEIIIKPGTRHFQSSRVDVTMDDHVRCVAFMFVLNGNLIFVITTDMLLSFVLCIPSLKTGIQSLQVT